MGYPLELTTTFIALVVSQRMILSGPSTTLHVRMLCAKVEKGECLMPLLVREVKYEEPCDWYLSGIGRNSGSEGWDTLVPTEPDYDARKQEDWPCEFDCDSVLAYTKVGVPSF